MRCTCQIGLDKRSDEDRHHRLQVTGIANHLVGPQGAVLVKDLAADFGVSGAPSTKAESLLRAWANGGWVEADRLGDAGLLVSTRRAAIIAMRDRYR